MSKFSLLISTALLLSTSLLPSIAIAAPKWVKVITDEDLVQNFVDKASIRTNKTSRNYTSARTVTKAVTSDEQMPLRRPYHGQRCPCPYDYAINESNCGGRSAYSRGGGASPLCYAPSKTLRLVISNLVNCKTKERRINAIQAYDSKNKPIARYTASQIVDTYPELVEVSDEAELKVINAVCSGSAASNRPAFQGSYTR